MTKSLPVRLPWRLGTKATQRAFTERISLLRQKGRISLTATGHRGQLMSLGLDRAAASWLADELLAWSREQTLIPGVRVKHIGGKEFEGKVMSYDPKTATAEVAYGRGQRVHISEDFLEVVECQGK